MNPKPFLSGLFNNLAVAWAIRNSLDQSEIYERIDIQAKKIEKERDTFKVGMAEYKNKSQALEDENKKLKEENKELKKKLDRFENPN